MICPSCSAQNADGAEVCFTCRTILSAVTQGSVIAGRYTILAPLGKGGMGTVYKAHDRVLDETVALKVLRPDLAESSDMAKRFRTEIKLARRVTHPNVCRIHEYGEDGRLHYISMELIEGIDLKHLLQDKGRFAPGEAYPIAIQLSDGLQAIHEAGIVHRDLKMPNLMLDSRRTLRVMDFGIAKRYEAEATKGATATGHIVGTPEYMSPEQAQGLKVDARSDIYAVGVVIYEMFTGQVPFKGETPVATLFKHIQDPPPLQGPRAAALPPALVPILRCALAKEPRQRYSSAKDLAGALRTALAAAGVEALPTLTPQLAATRDVASARVIDPTEALATPPQSPSPSTPGTATTVVDRSTANTRLGRSTPPRPVPRPTPWLGQRPARRSPWLYGAIAAAAIAAFSLWRGPTSEFAPAPAVATTPVPTSPGATLAPVMATLPPSTLAEAGTPAPRHSAPPSTLAERVRATPPPAKATPAPLTTLALRPASTTVAPELVVPTTQAIAPATPGTIVLTSDPVASIVLDGQPRGRTPATLSSVTPGKHTIVLSTDDGRVAQEEVVVPAGGTIERGRRFGGFGSLSITSDIWVDVRVDDRSPRPTPTRVDRLAAGTHVVRAAREGYKEQVIEVEIREGEARRLNIILEPK